jgi:hypothetical protein
MARGHGVIISLGSWASFVFEFNPVEITSTKKINYVSAPNIGGAFQKKYFTGFETKEISFQLIVIDMESPSGVSEEIAYFEALREPDPGITGGWGLTYGNVNYPPPKVMFQFGVSYIPLVWDVMDITIKETHFHSGIVRGILGIPKRAEINITLSLDEEDPLNKANQIAKKIQMYAASAKSITREVLSNAKGVRKEMPGLFPLQKNAGKGPTRLDRRY